MAEKPILFSGEMVNAILQGRKTQTRRVRGLEDVNSYPGRLEGPGGFGTLGYKGLAKSDYFLKPKKEFERNPGLFHCFIGEKEKEINPIPVKCPYGAIGDRLWVRESWRIVGWNEDGDWKIQYGSDGFSKWFDSVQEVTEDQSVDWWIQCGDDCEKAGLVVGEDDCYHWEDNPPTRWRPSIHMPRWASRINLEVVKVRVERVQDITEEDAFSEGVMKMHLIYENGPSYRDTFFNLWDRLNVGRGFGWDVNPWVWVINFKVV